ncbi:unnamed protein product [Brachionus calyciflorus]|uniref:Uncharacterized protein n=1 Tax=Brachionus calyciflorus TaxID=104777 RepID=A0A814BUR4_9BILA|nr:unnamed protein product [Brachionus calyciflorus]
MVFKNILNLNCHNDDIICLAYSSRGYLASCSIHDINIWDSKSFTIIASLKDNKAKFECIAFSNNKLISGSDLNLKIWYPSTGECLQTLEDIKRVKSICVLKDGKIAIAQKTGIIILNENFEKISEIDGKNYSIVGLGQLNNGNLVMVCDEQIKIFEINTLEDIETLYNNTNNKAFKVLQDGSLAIGFGFDSEVNILDKDNFRLKFKIECKKNT